MRSTAALARTSRCSECLVSKGEVARDHLQQELIDGVQQVRAGDRWWGRLCRRPAQSPPRPASRRPRRGGTGSKPGSSLRAARWLVVAQARGSDRNGRPPSLRKSHPPPARRCARGPRLAASRLVIGPSSGQPKADSCAWWNAGPMNNRSSPSLLARLARPFAQEGQCQVAHRGEVLGPGERSPPPPSATAPRPTGSKPSLIGGPQALRSLQVDEMLQCGLAEREQAQLHPGWVAVRLVGQVGPG